MNRKIMDKVIIEILTEKRLIDRAQTLADLLAIIKSITLPSIYRNLLVYDTRNCLRFHYPYESGKNYNKYLRLLIQAEESIIRTPETITPKDSNYIDVDMVNAVQNPFSWRFEVPYRKEDIIEIYRGIGPEEKALAEKGEIEQLGVWWAIRQNCAIAFAKKKKYACKGALLVARIYAKDIKRFYPYNNLDNSERVLIIPETIENFISDLRIVNIV